MTEVSSESSGSNDSLFSALGMSRCSTQTDLSVETAVLKQSGCALGRNTPRRATVNVQFSSSPLSSPPPILFDPYDRSDSPTDSSSECSGSEDADQDDEEASDFMSSQTSQARLRTMKGRDLFDCNIWSDPLKTSVFYRFATTLRQKVKEVEPTTTHHFIARLRDIGKLSRVYTQNIDEIEKKIGLSTDLKVGAGNKRRKSAKQQQLADTEQTGEDDLMQLNEEDDAVGREAFQSSQNPENGETTKQRATNPPDKGVECVFLHGSLQALRCFACARLCDWDAEDREAMTMSGEQPDCPHCLGATAARQEKGKRALGIGKLRPDIVLYGEEHPQSDLISPIVQHDLSAGPDLLLVLGTSLRVHGLKVMVREFAKAIHQKGGKVVFINFTKPSESIWGDIIDYWVQWDCDAWVDDLKERKPTLWMSPEAITEYEKLKREELADKRREAAVIKKRESVGEKKREASSNTNRRAIAHTTTERPRPKETPVPVPVPVGAPASLLITKRELEEQTPAMPEEPEQQKFIKPKEPAKNPQAARNDYNCGAYCMSKIAEAFFMIRGEKFDFFGYTPALRASGPTASAMLQPEVTRKPAVKAIKPRYSAPSILPGLGEPALNVERHRRPAVKANVLFGSYNKDKFKKAASELYAARQPQTSQRVAELRGPQGTMSNDNRQWTFAEFRLKVPENQPEVRGEPGTPLPAEQHLLLSTPPQLQAGMLPAAHAYRPTASVSAAVKSNPRKRKPTAKVKDNAPATPEPVSRARSVSKICQQQILDQENILPPFCVAMEKLAGPRLATMEPALNPSPPHSPLDQTPLASLSPNQRKFSLRHLTHPLMLSSPLIKLPFGVRKGSTPTPSDQLREEAAVALTGMRLCR